MAFLYLEKKSVSLAPWKNTLTTLGCFANKWLLSLLVIISVGFFLSGAKIYLKAQLAQWLIADAWQTTLQSGETTKPWAWADTWPVARLRSKKLPRDLFVLAGAHGSSLAFGPGHLDGTALPGEGASVVGGHRDTHFGFLKNMQKGDILQLQNQQGEWLSFEVKHMRIDDIREGYLGIDNRGDFLTLVTCYPFDAINPGGPLRYVVTAVQISP